MINKTNSNNTHAIDFNYVAGHPFHMVQQSPWPLVGSLAGLTTTIGGVLYMHSYPLGFKILSLGLVHVMFTMFWWWKDVIRESTYQGFHTLAVQRLIKLGFQLFIVSECMFFFGFFWAFFGAALAPVIEIGSVWPPANLIPMTNDVPFLNTLILLSSGCTVTAAHAALIGRNRREVIQSLFFTIFLGSIFTLLQAMEYYEATFTIADSIYGSVFYMLTGFHGFHVLIGTIFLIVMLIRHINYHLTVKHHLGFECAAWYWHFVDVVWIFVFSFVYVWGNKTGGVYSQLF